MAKEGIIRIFCGEGKGKTSAALGSAYKNLKEGSIAYILQFKKDENEARLLERFEPDIKVFNFDQEMSLNFSKKVIAAKECDVLVLDEILGIIDEDPANEEIILGLMELQKKAKISLIMTGNNITDRISEKADYITEFTRKK